MNCIARASRLALPAILVGCSSSEAPDPPVLFATQVESEDLERDWTPPIVAAVRPPPLSGGTLLVADGGHLAVVSDPDRDRIVLAELPSGTVKELALSPGDHPGRAVEDAQGTVHVVLRDGGAVVSIDSATREITARWPVCSAPRGIAYDAALDALHVACASGELVRFRTAEGLQAGTTRLLEPDLRDVVVTPDALLVSTLRGSNVLVVPPDGTVVSRIRPGATTAIGVQHVPSTAWRMIPSGEGGAYLLHSTARATPVELETEPTVSTPYGGGAGTGGRCDQPVRSALSLLSAAGVAYQYDAAPLGLLALAVDISRSEDDRLAIVAPTVGAVHVYRGSMIRPETECGNPDGAFQELYFVPQPVAVAFGADGLVVIQNREPPQLHLGANSQIVATIDLGGDGRADTGYELFHAQGSALTTNGIACASCHPEGREDGHVWHFEGFGPRRTQSLAGTLAGTAPFHWEGDLESLSALMDEVMARRMGAFAQSEERVAALQSWLETVSTPQRASGAFAYAVGDPERGRALFESEETMCASCHSGPLLTNNETVAVGTGEALQVPSLVGLSTRAPFMHDGCAQTLHDRFEPSCGGGELHGFTAHLSSQNVDDLVAYMMTL